MFDKDVVGSDEVKSALLDLVSHEQKQMLMCTQIHEDVRKLESLLPSESSSSSVGITGEKLSLLRELKESVSFLESISYKHTQLFIETQQVMASWYQQIVAHLKVVRPQSSDLPVPLPSHCEAFEYRNPLVSLEMEGSIERLCHVKSYIWACFADGTIRVVTPSHRNLPLFKSLKSFSAHSSPITSILYVPPVVTGSGSVWTAGQGSLRVWHPDTANQIAQIECDIPLSSMVLLSYGGKREIWGAIRQQAQIQVWNAEVSPAFSLSSWE